jgi:hypothetical protein
MLKCQRKLISYRLVVTAKLFRHRLADLLQIPLNWHWHWHLNWKPNLETCIASAVCGLGNRSRNNARTLSRGCRTGLAESG